MSESQDPPEEVKGVDRQALKVAGWCLLAAVVLAVAVLVWREAQPSPQVLVGAILAVGAACLIEGLLIFGRMQLFLNYGEQLLDECAQLLAQVPGKSAPPTEAPADVQPRVWGKRLRPPPDDDRGTIVFEFVGNTAAPGPEAVPTVELSQVIDDGLARIVEEAPLVVHGRHRAPEPATQDAP